MASSTIVITCWSHVYIYLGLVKCAGELGIALLVPRRKITVLLIGNHSAGKSSFINWYYMCIYICVCMGVCMSVLVCICKLSVCERK